MNRQRLQNPGRGMAMLLLAAMWFGLPMGGPGPAGASGDARFVARESNAPSGEARNPVHYNLSNQPLFLPGDGIATFGALDLYPNIETIGVVVSGANLPKTAGLMYRQSGETIWHSGHPLMRIDDGRLVGSLFGLSPSASYIIKVNDGANEISGSATTQPDELQFTPSSTVYVNDDASAGGDGSAAAPFRTIQEGVNHAGPGTRVSVADGIYYETVTFPASGTPGNWIQVRAEGNGAILAGAENDPPLVWTPVEGKKNVWSARIGNPTLYVARDQQRFYMYDDRSGLLQALGHDGAVMKEGWYFEPGTSKLYVRSLDDPASHAWQVARLDHAFDADGRDWLWIEGFEMRFYGTRDGCGVCMKNASHVVIRRNRIHNMQKGIFIEWTGGDARGNDTRVEYNEIYDPTAGEWSWNAVKDTSMAGTGIIIRGHIGAIVRGNEVHDFFNGIYAGSSAALENSGIAFDADVYNNRIHHIRDDALEPEGAGINLRFRNNTINTSYVGISLAPITQGPTWVLRSLFANYTGRGIKWDRGSDGIVLIYQNTSWTNAKGANSMDLISAASNAIMRNNVFQSNGFAFAEAPTGSKGNDWNHDNWYTTRTANSPHFKWENVDYYSIAMLCAATGLECNGHENPPGLANPGGGDFSLLPTSPNIDRGVVIPGINDGFSGSAPDVGAYEFAFDLPPAVQSGTRADSNPTNAAAVSFVVTFTEPVTGVDLAPPFIDFALNSSAGIMDASIDSVIPISANTYSVRVNTGSGSGLLRLDLVDDDSIVDTAGNPLGGPGAGNGSFSAGESYTVEKNNPFVTGILRMDPDPAVADTVHFMVTFSEEVSGVDGGDFAPLTTGGIADAAVVQVTGPGPTYTVAVYTGTGDGTLRLNLLDNDSILDAMGNPLAGAGAGNGNFTSGEAYTINKSAPSVTSSLRSDPDPTAALSVRFTVSFSEAVNGVDAGDFALTAAGGISGAAVMSVSGSGNTYVVTVGTGGGNGALRLDLIDNDSILDAAGLPLGGAGAGNGNFTGGQSYTVNKRAPAVTATFTSNGMNDGWVLESSEGSNRGGSGNGNSTTLNLGDDAKDRQYRAILHFPTASLPDNAVITLVILSIKRQGLSGADPFNSQQDINIDIRKGYFGSAGLFGINSLDLTDFQAPATRNSVGTIHNNPVGGWYWALLDSTALGSINLTGVTQFRLNFQIDDNDNAAADYLKFYSGNYATLSYRPQLVVEYYVP